MRIAERHRLVLLSDEIYDEILYDGAQFTPLAKLAGDVPCLSFDGLSKVQRACGYRVGWLSLTGAPDELVHIEHALDLLASLRLCANVPGQWAIAPSLQGEDTMSPLTAPGGRLHESRRAVLEHCARSEFLDVVAPMGALYAFPRVRTAGFRRRAASRSNCSNARMCSWCRVRVSISTRATTSASRCCRAADELRDVFARIEAVLQTLVAAQRHVA